MSEFHKPEQRKYEITPAGLRQRLEDIAVEFLAYTKPDAMRDNATSLLLDTTNGERVIIEKSIEGTQLGTSFLQDLNMRVHPGGNPDFYAQQVSFNFNQMGDDKLRKHVIGNEVSNIEVIAFNSRSGGFKRLAELAVHHSVDSAANSQLEEEMGLNNQPATPNEIAEAMAYLDGATVVDANDGYPYKPVGTVEPL